MKGVLEITNGQGETTVLNGSFTFDPREDHYFFFEGFNENNELVKIQTLNVRKPRRLKDTKIWCFFDSKNSYTLTVLEDGY